MKEKLKAFGAKARDGLKGLKNISKKVIIAILAVLVVMIVAAVALWNAWNSQPYTVLVTGVTSEEASAILTFLDEQGYTNYRVENNNTILVPESQAPAMKARVLMAGYPKSGFVSSYQYYTEHVSSLSTEAERTQAFLISTQDEIRSVIRNFDNVQDAAVNITPGEDHGYILETGNVVKASASVMLIMETGTRLTDEQATAIRHYVANAVQGLDVDSVSISDTLGNNYTILDESFVDADASTLKIKLEERYENKIRTEVMQVLLPLYGEGNVRVGVNCVVDVSQRTVNSRDVYLPEYAQDGSTNGEGIIGSQIYSYFVTRPGEEGVGGLVGSETNSDISEYVEDLADPQGNELALGGDGQVDYDNPYDETVTIYTAGYLTDCTVSVSINSTIAGNVNIQEMRQHVARASGILGAFDEETGQEFLEDKVSVVASPFYDPDPPLPQSFFDVVPLWVLIAAAVGLLLFLILLLVILRVRKKRRLRREEEEKQKELDAILAAAGVAQKAAEGADVMSMQTERSMELRKDIRQFTEENPEIAAQMVRSWLRGGEDSGGS